MPAELDYAHVTGRFGITVAEGGGPERRPIWCDEGEVKLSPLQSYARAQSSGGPASLGRAVFTGTINSDGYLVSDGERGVWVVDLTSPTVNPSVPEGATHRVEFIGLKARGVPVAFPSVPVRISGPENDLTELLPVEPGAPVPMLRGEPGASVREAYITETGQLALKLSDGTETVAEGGLPAGPGGSNEGVAGYITTEGPTKKALAASIEQGVAVEVPPHVARALAADDLPAQAAASAAAAAVAEEIEARDLVEGQDPRLPVQARTLADEGLVAAVTDQDGRRTWLEANDRDGGPTRWGESLLRALLGLHTSKHPEYLLAVTDTDNRLTDLAVRRSDGQLADFVVARLAARIGPLLDLPATSPAPGADPAATYLDATGLAPDGPLRPVHTRMTAMAGWGSSSQQGLDNDLAAMAAGLPGGVSYFSGGKGGERIEHSLARLGSHPWRATFPEGAVPASGVKTTFTVPHSSAPAGAHQLKSYSARVAGTEVVGTVASDATSSTVFTFTRTDGGATPVPVPDGVELLPLDGLAHRDAVTVLWLGKNNLTASGDSDTQVIRMTDEAVAWLSPLVKRVLVIGQFVNTGASGASVDRIRAVNAHQRARYGRAFIDVPDYLSSPQVWVHTGITPTAQDEAEQAAGRKPPSLSSDTGHLNTAAEAAILTHLIRPRLTELGWY